MFRLCRHRRDVSLTGRPLLFCVGASFHSAIAPVITHSIVDLGHSRFIDVVDDRDIYVSYGAVVIEVVVIPASALITIAKISEAVADAAVETHGRTPISLM